VTPGRLTRKGSCHPPNSRAWCGPPGLMPVRMVHTSSLQTQPPAHTHRHLSSRAHRHLSSRACRRVALMNDFAAVGYGIPALDDSDFVALNPGTPHEKVGARPGARAWPPAVERRTERWGRALHQSAARKDGGAPCIRGPHGKMGRALHQSAAWEDGGAPCIRGPHGKIGRALHQRRVTGPVLGGASQETFLGLHPLHLSGH